MTSPFDRTLRTRCLMLSLVALPCTAWAATDEDLANDFFYCGQLSSHLASIYEAPDKKKFWDEQRVVYLASGIALTSPEYARDRINVAKFRVLGESSSGAGQTEAVTRQWAETLATCRKAVGENMTRVSDLMKQDPASQKRFVGAIRESRLAVPQQGWTISFDAPVLMKLYEADHPKQYKYSGSSGAFTVSIFVEAPKCEGGDTHEDVFKCLGPLIRKGRQMAAEANPSYGGEGAWVVTPQAAYYRIDSSKELPGTAEKTSQYHYNVNYLFAYRGKWIDVHVSGRDKTAIDRFERTLRYGE